MIFISLFKKSYIKISIFILVLLKFFLRKQCLIFRVDLEYYVGFKYHIIGIENLNEKIERKDYITKFMCYLTIRYYLNNTFSYI